MTNDDAIYELRKSYPRKTWSCSEVDGDVGEVVVTFQRYTDDAEDRYVVRDGQIRQV